MTSRKKNFFAVVSGRKPGIYTSWTGKEGAQAQVMDYPDALYRGFMTREEAETWLANPTPIGGEKNGGKNVVIYTDGGCINNPGPGGYGAVLIYGNKRKEISAGFKMTTNNRMELVACIEALQLLKFPCDVTLYSDSQYVVNGITKGWAKRWRNNGWMRLKEKPAENADLWARLMELCDIHRVDLNWVKGHAGHPENERCDELANSAARSSENQERDMNFETGATTKNRRIF